MSVSKEIHTMMVAVSEGRVHPDEATQSVARFVVEMVGAAKATPMPGAADLNMVGQAEPRSGETDTARAVDWLDKHGMIEMTTRRPSTYTAASLAALLADVRSTTIEACAKAIEALPGAWSPSTVAKCAETIRGSQLTSDERKPSR